MSFQFKWNAMNNMQKYCEIKKECGKPDYLKVVSSGNDPSISKAMRYSQYVRSGKTNKPVIINYPVTYNLPVVFLKPQIIVRAFGPGYLFPIPPPSK